MGNLFSSPEKSYGGLLNRIEFLEESGVTQYDIEQRIAELEKFADSNQDGVVTKEEMETYLTTRLQAREIELIELKDALEEEKEKCERLKVQYERLLDQYNTEHPEAVSISKISRKALKKYVEEMLDTPEHNWGFVPDILEKPAKIKEYKLALGILEKLFNLGHFDIAGHRIQGSIRPIEE